MEISLYMCGNAIVRGEQILCKAGHRLSAITNAGTLHIRSLATGKPLKCQACQNCPDYDRMGGDIPIGDRGWVTLSKSPARIARTKEVKEVADYALSELDLPTGVEGALRRNSIRTITQLRQKSDDELLSIRTVGPIRLRGIREQLEKHERLSRL